MTTLILTPLIITQVKGCNLEALGQIWNINEIYILLWIIIIVN